MFSFVQGFTDFERECYLQISHPPRMTVCRISLQIIHNRGIIQTIEELCVNDEYRHIHAEKIAIANIIARLKSECYYMPFTGHTLIDLDIKLNNSSCVDCQNTITRAIDELEEIIGGKLVNLQLFFSHLYKGPRLTMKQAIDHYSDWIIQLVANGITVRLFPIIVLNMVQWRNYLYPPGIDIDKSYYWDGKLRDHFLELHDRIYKTTSYNIHFNFNFDELLLIQSWHNLKYIRISRL